MNASADYQNINILEKLIRCKHAKLVNFLLINKSSESGEGNQNSTSCIKLTGNPIGTGVEVFPCLFYSVKVWLKEPVKTPSVVHKLREIYVYGLT